MIEPDGSEDNEFILVPPIRIYKLNLLYLS